MDVAATRWCIPLQSSSRKRASGVILLRQSIWILIEIYHILIVVAIILLLVVIRSRRLHRPLRLPRVLLLSLPLVLIGGSTDSGIQRTKLSW